MFRRVVSIAVVASVALLAVACQSSPKSQGTPGLSASAKSSAPSPAVVEVAKTPDEEAKAIASRYFGRDLIDVGVVNTAVFVKYKRLPSKSLRSDIERDMVAAYRDFSKSATFDEVTITAMSTTVDKYGKESLSPVYTTRLHRKDWTRIESWDRRILAGLWRVDYIHPDLAKQQ